MKPWTQVEPSELEALDLHAHALLEGVPLHDAWRIELPGGGPGRTLDDVRALLRFDDLGGVVGRAVRALFALRAALGRWLRLGDDAPPAAEHSFLARVPSALREASQPPAGAREGPFRLLYATPDESVGEVRNATVHAFSVMALRPTPTGAGYRLYWGVYVAPVGAITRLYMALIDPFRRFLVYPALLRHVHRRWIESAAGHGSSRSDAEPSGASRG